MSPIFALIIMFFESSRSLHIAILGSTISVGGSRKGMVPAFFKFQIAAGDRSGFIFSKQDGLCVISCSLAALFQTAKFPVSPLRAIGSPYITPIADGTLDDREQCYCSSKHAGLVLDVGGVDVFVFQSSSRGGINTTILQCIGVSGGINTTILQYISCVCVCM